MPLRALWFVQEPSPPTHTEPRPEATGAMAMGEPFASADWIGFAAGAFSPCAAEMAPCVLPRAAKPLRASLEAHAALTTVSPLTD